MVQNCVAKSRGSLSVKRCASDIPRRIQTVRISCSLGVEDGAKMCGEIERECLSVKRCASNSRRIQTVRISCSLGVEDGAKCVAKSRGSVSVSRDALATFHEGFKQFAFLVP